MSTSQRKNLFGFGRKPAPVKPSGRKRGSALTISAASAQAREAGYRGRYTFSDWLDMKHLEGRGQLVINRLGDAYRAGADRREKDDAAKIQTRERKREAARAKVEKHAGSKAASYLSVPDEKKIQEGFKRGLTLNEILQGNSALRKLRQSNPSKFDRCVEAVQAKGGAANAYAVCTAAGTRNKRNPELAYRSHSTSGQRLKLNTQGILYTTPDEDYSKNWGEHTQELEISPTNTLDFTRFGAQDSVSIEEMAEFLGRHGVTFPPALRNREERELLEYFGQTGGPLVRALKRAGYDSARINEYVYGGGSSTSTLLFSTRLAKPVSKMNPATAAAEVFQEFHGFEPSEVITVTKKVHYHKHLAAAGKLESLDVWGVDDQGHRISGFKGALLAFNETKNQLFVEGGDQSIDLADFGIDSPHELETLGRLTDIGYHTKKTHLGDEGGEAVYVHKFRTTNDGGKHVVVKIARYPDLIYDVRNEQLLFSGGSYEIIAEGIDK